MKDMKIKFVVLGVIFLLIRKREACSCFPSHPQQLFCDADFAVKAIVTSEKPTPTYADTGKELQDGVQRRPIKHTFELTLLNVYRGQEAILEIPRDTDQQRNKSGLPSLKLFRVNITSAFGDSFCGIDLTYSVNYLIFGRIEGERLVTSLCNFHSEWEEVTDQVKRGILGDYDCNCNVQTRTSIENEAPDYSNEHNTTCYWNMSPSELVDECAMNFLTCRKLVTPIFSDNVVEECVWVEGKEFKECQQP